MRRTVGVIAAAVTLITIVLAWRWPFRQDRVIESFQRSTHCDLRVSGFRMHFFPSPGCTLERPVFSRSQAGAPPLATAERIELRTAWTNLLTFRKRLSLLRATDLRVELRRPVPAGKDFGGGPSETTVAELIADGATLAVDNLHFALPQFRLTGVSRNSAIGFTILVDSPHPPGRIHSTGSVGPFKTDPWGATPVHGRFEVQRADLGRYRNLAGTLHAKGDFAGTLGELKTQGRLDISGFEVNGNGHPTDLAASWDAAVNAMTGAVRLNAVETDFLHTHLSAAGTIENEIVDLDFTSRKARLEDLARLTTRSGTSALHGPMTLDTHIRLLPERGRFVQRLRVDGKFRIDNGWWRKSRTQTKIDELSARARREKEQAEDEDKSAERVRTDLAGHVEANNGVVRFSSLTFHVPGATATGMGTYNLLTKRIDVKGTVTMVADVSEATSGIKSVLLKPFDALFRRRHRKHGATLPVAITGTYPHPHFGVRLH